MTDPVPLTVFVVDDDNLSRHLLCHMIRSFGWLAVGYASRQMFLGALPVLTADCILLDVDLPDGDGLSVLKAARLRGNGTPAILLTMNPAAISPERASAAGAFAILRKPIERHELRSQLVRAIEADSVPVASSPNCKPPVMAGSGL